MKLKRPAEGGAAVSARFVGVNEAIARDLPVHYEEMSVDEARARGAIGLFKERYGERIKVYIVGDFSSEICGGPHCWTYRTDRSLQNREGRGEFRGHPAHQGGSRKRGA
jgi:hypothetical protein